MPQFSFQLSPIKAIELAASRIPGVISLAQGIPSFSTPAVIREFVQEKITQGLCDKYSLTSGLAELREEIALCLSKEGLKYDSESEIIVTCGSIEAISAAVLSCTKPGDEIIIPSPTYASYLGSLGLARVTPRFAALDEDHNYDFHLQNIEKALTRNTRAILYCSPNNPTGTVYSQQKTRDLAKLALERNLLLIIDEVYKDFYYGDEQHFTPALIPEMRDNVIRICSFSKAYAMTGWRIGFVHGSRDNMQNLLRFHDAMVTCAPVVSQYAAIAALRHAQDFQKEFRLEFKRRRDYCIQRLDELSHIFDYQVPRATYFVFPRVKDTIALARDSNKLAYDILEKVKLALVPGIAFGPTGESHLRISFGREMHEIQQGFDRLAQYFCKSSSPVRSMKSSVTEIRPVQADPLRGMVSFLLAWGARKFLARKKPLIIGIAGTKGKTVFKRILADTLALKHKTRSGILSYNTEIGFPLSVLGLSLPKTLREKLQFILSFFQRACFSQVSEEILVLEYGVRNKSDALNLLQVCRPDWLVISGVEGSDPGLNYMEIQEGLAHLLQAVPKSQILWNAGDAIASEMCSDLSQGLGLQVNYNGGGSANAVSESMVLAEQAAHILTSKI